MHGNATHPLRQSRLLPLLLFAGAFPEPARAQVLLDKRIGNNTEDIEFIREGRYKHHVAAMDGTDVLVLARHAVHSEDADEGDDKDQTAFRKAFDVRGLPLVFTPRGMSFMDESRQFVFADPGQLDRYLVSDERGAPRPPIHIQYPNGFTPGHMEGVAYFHHEHGPYAGHLAGVVYDSPGFHSHVLLIRPSDGQVVKDIVPQSADIQNNGALSVEVWDEERPTFLVTSNNQIYVMDGDGNILVTHPPLADSFGFEGIASDGKEVYAADYAHGHVWRFDERFRRQPKKEQDFLIGLGLSRAVAAFRTGQDDYLIPDNITFHPVVRSVPRSLDSSRVVADVSADGLSQPMIVAAMPDEESFALSDWDPPPQLYIYRYDGTLTQTLFNGGRIVNLDYVLPTHQFAVQNRSRALFPFLRLLDRNGSEARRIDLRHFRVAGNSGFCYFNPAHPSGGEFLIFGPADAAILDFNGNLVRRFEYHDRWNVLGVGCSAITSGPDAGAFVLSEYDTSRILVVRLP